MEPIGHRWFPLARVSNVYSSVYSVVLHYYPSYSSYLVICIRWLQFLVFIHPWWSMMTAQCGSIFCVADLLCGELTTGGFPLQGLVMRAFLYCVALLSVPQFLFSFMYKSDCSSSFLYTHDDVMIWKHFPLGWPLVRGTHQSPVASQCRGW